ncbi:class 1 isoprenoid biosynthesis enzyme [Sunxiuqinia elliptica]
MNLDALTDKFVEQWNRTSSEKPNWGAVVDAVEKKQRAACVDRFFKSMKKLEPGLASSVDQPWIDALILIQLRDLFQEAFAYQHEEIDLMFSQEMMNSTKAFVRKARAMDSELSMTSIFQACRNVWIMNGLQLILGRKVELTPSIFAYSMLYPYTDNFVDDPEISRQEKQLFSLRFEQRLSGERIAAVNDHERKIFGMVELIEGQYTRGKYPGVFNSLLDIHRAQTESMVLLNADSVTSEEALRVCLAKGGASVLADGYLIAGDLTPKEVDFLYGYGAYLQLLDDIQDVGEDLNDGLMTCFSMAGKEQELDEVLYKTFNFGDAVLDSSKDLWASVNLDFKGLLQKSILLFFVESVATDTKYYSPQLQLEIEEVSPLSLEFVRSRRNFFTPQKHLMLAKLEKLVRLTEADSVVS